MKISIIISAISEWTAVKELYPQMQVFQYPYGEAGTLTLAGWNLKLYHGGWGKISSAGVMQYIIDHDQPDLTINLGTCGGFEGVLAVGDIVLVERTYVYDIVELMGDLSIDDYYASTLDLSWLPDPTPFPVRRGLIASADSDLPPEKIPYLKSKGAIAGDWESGALAWVANKNNARLLILRGVSDLVSEHAGEVYDDFSKFEERAKEVMEKLFSQLPAWLNGIKE
jgi:adenosylhomocysteine nucleosidase